MIFECPGLKLDVSPLLALPRKLGQSEENSSEMRRAEMLSWAATFFVIAIIAAVLGFGGIAAGAAEIAKLLFVLFLILFAVTLIMGLVQGRSPRTRV